MQRPAKVVLPEETLEEARARLEVGSMKRAIFDALEAAGKEGLPVASLVQAVQVLNPLPPLCFPSLQERRAQSHFKQGRWGGLGIR